MTSQMASLMTFLMTSLMTTDDLPHQVAELRQTLSELRTAMGDDAAKAQSQIEQLKGQLEVLLRRHHEATPSLMTTLMASDDLPHQVLRRHHEATTVEQRMQMDVLQKLREEEAKESRDRLEALARAKRQQASQFSEQLRAVKADREADANHLHAKIERLRSLHTAAIAAGSVRARPQLEIMIAIMRASACISDCTPDCIPERIPVCAC